jgi:glutamyl-tRNA synthetase
MSSVVVRFAPSPTGYLHIGGARTAIFNWLFARKHKGKFILRIEDTDTERSTESAISGIVEGLQWLGLDWDEGPYFQSDFANEHRAAAQNLLNSGWAYKCFCSKEELETKRNIAQAQKQTYRYDGKCRHLNPFQIAENEARNIPYTIRLKVPRNEGAVVFEDLVYGKITKKYCDIEDFVIVRANGQPLYVLSNAVDDIRDGITHVIRGQDGLANTPKQILIYDGLGAELPRFVHMSLTLDPQKTKISKRKHGEQVAIHYYRQNGFLPWAMINFLVLLGWSASDSKEYFDKRELMERFDLNGIGRTNSVFNITNSDSKFMTDPKLISINTHYLRSMPIEELAPYVKDLLISAQLWVADYDGRLKPWFLDTLELIRGRYHLLSDFISLGSAYFNDTFPVDENAYEKHLLRASAQICRWMPVLADTLETIALFEKEALEPALRTFLSQYEMKPGELINPVRTALTGQGVGPEFIAVLVALGRHRVVARLRSTVAKIQKEKQ